MIKQYRKKPVVIEAIKYEPENYHAALKFGNGAIKITLHGLSINTLEGKMLAKPGDYIIKGVAGEFYPCKPDIFEQTYEEVTP